MFKRGKLWMSLVAAGASIGVALAIATEDIRKTKIEGDRISTGCIRGAGPTIVINRDYLVKDEYIGHPEFFSKELIDIHKKSKEMEKVDVLILGWGDSKILPHISADLQRAVKNVMEAHYKFLLAKERKGLILMTIDSFEELKTKLEKVQAEKDVENVYIVAHMNAKPPEIVFSPDYFLQEPEGKIKITDIENIYLLGCNSLKRVGWRFPLVDLLLKIFEGEKFIVFYGTSGEMEAYIDIGLPNVWEKNKERYMTVKIMDKTEKTKDPYIDYLYYRLETLPRLVVSLRTKQYISYTPPQVVGRIKTKVYLGIAPFD